MEIMEQFVQLLRRSQQIVFFGGAGVSTESGIPDFRSADGLYSEKLSQQFTPEQLVSHTFFERYPEEFFAFYRQHLLYPAAQPNDAHRALARLEKLGKLRAVVTQNIDGLHQRAGSERVLELHGSVLRNYCEACHAFYGVDTILGSEGVPRCSCGGRIKPDVVLYEEALDQRVLQAAVREMGQADLLIIGGTSLVVYPAAGLIRYFGGEHLVLINRSATAADHEAEMIFREPIGQVLGEAVKRLCS